MRLLLLAAAAPAVFVVATSAHAQVGPPPAAEDDPCAAFNAIGAGGPREADGAAAPDVPIDPGFSFLQLVSPPTNASNVPRNVEIRLAGDPNALDADPPTFLVEVIAGDDSRVPLTRDGLTLKPVAPLDARAGYLIHIEPTDANPCPDCVGVQDLPFSTGDDVDTSAPELDGAPPVNVFVLPSPEEAARCNLFFGQTHQVVVDFGPSLPVNTWYTIVGKPARGDVKKLLETFNTGQAFPFFSDFGATLPVALGDEFLFAFTPRDLAGNGGGARIVRTRARSFIDENVPREQLDPLWCELPSRPQLSAAASVPMNGRVQIEFPFEETPVAIKNSADGTQTPLIPVEDIDGGHVYNTAIPLDPGEYDVVALDCPHCVCLGCAVPPGESIGGKIVVGDVVDTAPPSAPKVKSFREDAAPALSAAETCHPDRPALIAVLAPGKDDHASPLDLRYDAAISVDGGPALALARSLVPFQRGDGNVALRIDTRGLGRVLGRPFDLTLTAVDAAGNKTDAVAHHEPDDASDGGCASTRAASPAWALVVALAALAPLRRRRRL